MIWSRCSRQGKSGNYFVEACGRLFVVSLVHIGKETANSLFSWKHLRKLKVKEHQIWKSPDGFHSLDHVLETELRIMELTRMVLCLQPIKNTVHAPITRQNTHQQRKSLRKPNYLCHRSITSMSIKPSPAIAEKKESRTGTAEALIDRAEVWRDHLTDKDRTCRK